MKSILELTDRSKQAYYYYEGKRIYVMPVTDRVLIGLKLTKNHEEKTAILNGLAPSGNIVDVAKLNPDDAESASDRFIIANLREGWRSAETTEFETQVRNNSEIAFISPFYQAGTPDYISTTLEFFVKTGDGESPEKHRELYDKYGVEHTEEFDQDSHVFLLRLKEKNEYNALEVANAFQETGKFVYASPNFFHLVKLPQFIPDDPLYDEQENLQTLNMPNSWTISRGNGMRIGILDAAVIATHIDLAPNIVPGADYTNQPLGTDRHGTWVAGVAAARGDNDEGVAGTAFEASIIPVRIGYTVNVQQRVVIMDSWVVQGINACADENDLAADVINCSFALAGFSQTVSNAINNAYSNGRGGRGLTIIASTGNDFAQSVRFPGNHTNVIGVGAMNPNNQRADFSNWGNGIDISAPGTNIVTTTINNGYTTPFEDLRGTSYSSPTVAAVVALMLTVNPNAAPATIKSRLQASADRIGGYNYVGGWCPELGAGRVNPRAALLQMINAYILSGQQYLCVGQQTTYSISGANQVTWSVDQGMNINPTTGVATTSVNTLNGILATVNAEINTGFIIINRQKTIPIAAYYIEFFANGYSDSNWYRWANMYMPIFFGYNVNNLGNRIEFGYAPILGRTTTNPWSYGDPPWQVFNSVTGVQIISQPWGWTNVQVLSNEIRVSNGDPEGLLQVRLSTLCGDADVIFDIRRQ